MSKKITSVLSLLLAMCLLLCACSGEAGSESTGSTDATQTTTPYVSHAVTVGSHELDSTTFNYFYTDAIGYFYEVYYDYFGSYASLYIQMYTGMSPSTALGEQIYDEETGKTWADYFVEEALDNAKWTYAMCDLAKAQGYTMPADQQASLDTLIEDMEKTATHYGYDGFLGYLQELYGADATVESFIAYYTDTIYSACFSNEYYASLTYTDQDYRDYEAGRFRDFSSYSYAACYLNVEEYLTWAGAGTTVTNADGTTTTYTDAEKEAAVQAALQDAKLLAGCSSLEELNAALAGLAIYRDAENAPEASVIEDMLLSEISYEAAVQWLDQEDRQLGDITWLEEETDGEVSGYYVLLLLDYNDNTMHLANVRHVLIAFEGGVTNNITGEVTYSDAEKAAARQEAEILLNDWLTGDRSDASFAEMADKQSDDSPEGGLYENITPDTNFVENFLNWCFEGHDTGDTGIIETEYGYHIMYYKGDSELTYRDYLIGLELAEADYAAWEEKVQENVTVTTVDLSAVDTTKTVLG